MYLDEQGGILDTDLASLNDFDATHKQQREAQTIAHTNERNKQLEDDLEQDQHQLQSGV